MSTISMSRRTAGGARDDDGALSSRDSWSGARHTACQRAAQLAPRRDAKLRVHLAEVPLHRAGADEQLGTDLGVGVTLGGKSGDLGFLGRDFVAGVDGALAHRLAGGGEFAGRPLSEALDTHGGERLVCQSQVVASIDPPALATPPLTI